MSFVYFALDTGFGRVKIGHSKYPFRRIGGLEQQLGRRLEIIAIFEGNNNDEKSLHRKYAALHVKGENRPAPTEWFVADKDLLEEARRRGIVGGVLTEHSLKSVRVYRDVHRALMLLKADAGGLTIEEILDEKLRKILGLPEHNSGGNLNGKQRDG